jgi:hypothetical protein
MWSVHAVEILFPRGLSMVKMRRSPAPISTVSCSVRLKTVYRAQPAINFHFQAVIAMD